MVVMLPHLPVLKLTSVFCSAKAVAILMASCHISIIGYQGIADQVMVCIRTDFRWCKALCLHMVEVFPCLAVLKLTSIFCLGTV